MRTIAEAVEDIKSILNNIERTENCDGETLVDINELTDEILTISAYKGKKQTNADRIRSMSDEELAEFLIKTDCCIANAGEVDCSQSDECGICGEVIRNWLQSEVEE